MDSDWYQRLIEEYKTSQKTISRINEIFAQGDIRYADVEYEVIVAGFLDNKAITIEEKPVVYGAGKSEAAVKGPQKDLKKIAINLLENNGFQVENFEKQFHGGIADIIAKNKNGEWIGVECGPCVIRKAIDYLEKPDTKLWVLTPGGILFEVKRGENWYSFHDFYISKQNEEKTKAVEKAFSKKKCQEIEFFAGRRKIPRALKPEEVAEIFSISKGNTRDDLILKLMYFSGLRNSEIQNLKIGDIDVEKSLLKASKRGKKRSVPLPKALITELNEYTGHRGGGPVFRGRDEKGRISDRHIRRIVKDYAKAANVRKYEEIHPHTLRHSYATHLQNSGVPLNVIQSLLGHERIETTTIYTHMGIEKAKEFVEKAFETPPAEAKKPENDKQSS